MANLNLKPVKTAAQCKAEMQAAQRRLNRRIRQIESEKSLSTPLGAALAAALKSA